MVLPTLTFTIPSIQDHIELECRLYIPATSSSSSKGSTSDRPKTRHASLSGAIVAHPYANLGGCFDDPAVLAAADAFLRAGSVVGTFNFRGAGGSKGSTSWTGTPELADYVSFAGFFTRFLALLAQDVSPNSSSPSAPSGSPTLPSTTTLSSPLSSPLSSQSNPRISLILCGYSYGSRILTYLPSVSAIAARFSSFPSSPSSSVSGSSSNFAPGSAEAVIAETAACLAAKVRGDERTDSDNGSDSGGGSVQNTPDEPSQPSSSSRRRSRQSVSSVGGSEGPSPSARHTVGASLRRSVENAVTGKRGGTGKGSGDDNSGGSKQAGEEVARTPPGGDRRVDVDLRYVLISPVLGAVGWFTSPGLDRPVPENGGAGDGAVATMRVAGWAMDVADAWWQYPSLVVFGRDDQFTAARKVRQWVAGLAEPDDGGGVKVAACELEGQGHFWHSREAGARLQEAIGDWLVRNPAGDALR